MTNLRSLVAATVGLLAACLVAVPTEGQSSAPAPSRPTYSAAATGTALYAGVLDGPVTVRAGFSAAAVDASGLGTRFDQLGAIVAAGGGTRRAEARGRGL
ncbi:MAG: hypothetical protein ACRDYV_06020, partial [Acidimicrobiia bacterium]